MSQRSSPSRIDRWVASRPDALAPEVRSRARMVALFAAILASAALGFLLLFAFTLSRPHASVVLGAGGLGAVGALVVQRRTNSPQVSGNVLTLAFYVVLTGLVTRMGGLDSVALTWYTVVPVVALSTAGRRAAYVWLGVCLASLAALHVVSLAGVRFPDDKAGRPLTGLIEFLSMAGLYGLLLAIAMLHDSMKDHLREKANRSRKRFQDVASVSSDWIWEIDRDGRYTYCSGSVGRVLGYQPDELLGTRAFDLIDADDLDRCTAVFERAVADEAPFVDLVNRCVTRSGATVCVTTSGVPIFDESGTLIGYRGIDRDITDRIRSEQALRQANERFALAAEIAGIGVWEWDAGTDDVTWDRQMHRIYGVDPDTDERLYDVWKSSVHPDDEETVNRHVQHSIRTGDDIDVTFRIRPGDGKTTWIRSFARLGSTEVGEQRRKWTGVSYDVTKLKRAELEMRELAEAAQTASLAKSAFLANMSHEMRTPLNGVIGMTSLLLEGDLEAEQAARAQTIRASSEALLAIVNDVLDFSKIEAGKVIIDESPFAPRDLLHDVWQMFSPTAEQQGIALRFVVDPTVPERVVSDAGRLRQILVNLVGNSLKFTPEGEVSVEVKAGSEDCEEPETLTFSVRDTGVGIPEDKLDTIFESFAQADVSTARRHGGTGLGLSISKKLVEAMGGSIVVDSAPGRGAAFRFEVRVSKAGPAPEVRDESDAAALPRPGARVLLVDDNAVNLRVAKAMLERLDLEVDEAGDGERALELLAERRYDVVLMDVQMPGMDGLAATRRLRSGESGALDSKLPVIAMTAHALAEDREACLHAGMDDYLTKPIVREALRDALARWIPSSVEVSPVRAHP
jgi:PAS domain S-box-containing protein